MNSRFRRDTYDGLRRVIRAERRTVSRSAGTVVSQMDTDYDSCGCSPTGKMVRASEPCAPNPVYRTTYTYDGLAHDCSAGARWREHHQIRLSCQHNRSHRSGQQPEGDGQGCGWQSCIRSIQKGTRSSLASGFLAYVEQLGAKGRT